MPPNSMNFLSCNLSYSTAKYGHKPKIKMAARSAAILILGFDYYEGKNLYELRSSLEVVIIDVTCFNNSDFR